jgi:hypothetical protein
MLQEGLPPLPSAAALPAAAAEAPTDTGPPFMPGGLLPVQALPPLVAPGGLLPDGASFPNAAAGVPATGGPPIMPGGLPPLAAPGGLLPAGAGFPAATAGGISASRAPLPAAGLLPVQAQAPLPTGAELAPSALPLLPQVRVTSAPGPVFGAAQQAGILQQLINTASNGAATALTTLPNPSAGGIVVQTLLNQLPAGGLPGLPAAQAPNALPGLPALPTSSACQSRFKPRTCCYTSDQYLYWHDCLLPTTSAVLLVCLHHRIAETWAGTGPCGF